MQLLYVLIGGVLVAAGYALAKIDWKRPEKQVVVQAPEKEEEPVPELPKSGIPIEDQYSEMQSYDPRKAHKQGKTEA